MGRCKVVTYGCYPNLFLGAKFVKGDSQVVLNTSFHAESTLSHVIEGAVDCDGDFMTDLGAKTLLRPGNVITLQGEAFTVEEWVTTEGEQQGEISPNCYTHESVTYPTKIPRLTVDCSLIAIRNGVNKVNCDHLLLDEEDLVRVCNEAASAQKLTGIGLSHNYIDDTRLEHVLQFICRAQENASLTWVGLYGNTFSNEGLKRLIDTVRGHCSLYRIQVGGMPQLDPAIVSHLGAVLKDNANTTGQHFTYIYDGVKYNHSVAPVTIPNAIMQVKNGYNKINCDNQVKTARDHELLFELLDVLGHSNVECLGLAHNNLSDNMCAALASALQQSSSIRWVGLFGNKITDDGARVLLQASENHRSLTKVNLLSNAISQSVLHSFENALTQNEHSPRKGGVSVKVEFDTTIEVVLQNIVRLGKRSVYWPKVFGTLRKSFGYVEGVFKKGSETIEIGIATFVSDIGLYRVELKVQDRELYSLWLTSACKVPRIENIEVNEPVEASAFVLTLRSCALLVVRMRNVTPQEFRDTTLRARLENDDGTHSDNVMFLVAANYWSERNGIAEYVFDIGETLYNSSVSTVRHGSHSARCPHIACLCAVSGEKVLYEGEVVISSKPHLVDEKPRESEDELNNSKSSERYSIDCNSCTVHSFVDGLRWHWQYSHFPFMRELGRELLGFARVICSDGVVCVYYDPCARPTAVTDRAQLWFCALSGTPRGELMCFSGYYKYPDNTTQNLVKVFQLLHDGNETEALRVFGEQKICESLKSHPYVHDAYQMLSAGRLPKLSKADPRGANSIEIQFPFHLMPLPKWWSSVTVSGVGAGDGRVVGVEGNTAIVVFTSPAVQVDLRLANTIVYTFLNEFATTTELISELGTTLYTSFSSASTREDKQMTERWIIKQHLGRGGQADVVLASDTVLKIDIALRTVTIKSTSSDSLIKWKQLQKECGFLEELQRAAHPNIVKIYDLVKDEENRKFYFVMELMKSSLTRGCWCQERDLFVLEKLRQILSGLNCAHGKGIIHCDLKPANILIDEQGRCCISDFGSATRESEKVFASTCLYLPPNFDSCRTHASNDIWSFGLTALECISNIPAYGKPAHEIPQLPKFLINFNSPPWAEGYPIDHYHPDITQPLVKKFLTSCLYLDPARRPSAAELLTVLDTTLKELQMGEGYAAVVEMNVG